MEPKTLEELARLCGATLEGDGGRTVRGPATLAEAGPDEIAFLGHPRYVEQLASTRAAAVLVERDRVVDREGLALLRCDDPGRAFTEVLRAFVADDPKPEQGVHPAASVAEDATVDPTASIGPGVVIEPGATIGPRAVLRAQVFVGRGSSVGADTTLEPGVVLYARTWIGERCVVHSGVVLGADGFGFDPRPEGWVKVPQVGRVVVEDDAEIGANCTIDRARFGATRIGRGAKLDNLVHVAHNVQIGAGVLLIAQAGIAGSAEIGDRAILAGQVGVAGHVRVGAGVRVGGQSGVYGDLPVPGDYTGTPARPRLETLRARAVPKRVERLVERVAALEARLAAVEQPSREGDR